MDASTEVRPATKRRRWWVAGLLGLPVPGLGQIYNSQARKAVLGWLVYVFLLCAVAGLAISPLPPWTAGLCFLLVLLLRLFLVIEGIFAARRLGSAYVTKRYNRWPVYVA